MKYDLLNQFSDDTAFHEMALIGEFDAYVVWVGTDDEGIVPHFHVWDTDTTGGKFHTCIQLEKAAYYRHTGKETAFDSKSKELLCRFLRSPSEDEPEKTNWQVLVIEWNRNNSTRKVENDIQMPDYQLLEKGNEIQKMVKENIDMEERFSSPAEAYHNVKLEKIDGFLVACAAAKETGLPYDVLLDSLGAEKEHPGCPRIGVAVGNVVVPVSISEKPVILSGYAFEGNAQICDWVSKHHIPLKMHWNKALSDLEMLRIAESDKK